MEPIVAVALSAPYANTHPYLLTFAANGDSVNCEATEDPPGHRRVW